jgi:hypothetical protein
MKTKRRRTKKRKGLVGFTQYNGCDLNSVISLDNFFTTGEEPDDESSTRRNHALLNRNFAAEDKSPEEIANAIVGRHRDRPAPYTGDMNEIPQRLLMPSVHDASLWQVRVKVRTLNSSH